MSLPPASEREPKDASDVWFLGRLLAGFCIGLGLLAWAGWGDWSGVAVGVYVWWQSGRESSGTGPD